MSFRDYIERYSAELSSEEFFTVTLLQLLIVVLVYYDMSNRHFSKTQRIVLLGLVVLFPVPGTLVYFLTVLMGFGERELFSCSVCGEKFEEVPDYCPVCGNPFKEVEKKERYVCRCGKTFETWKGWKNHVRMEHENSEKHSVPESEENICDVCGKSFDTERGLHIHQSKVHEN